MSRRDASAVGTRALASEISRVHPTMPTGTTAVAHLSAIDPVMKELIGAIGPCPLKPRSGRSPFESLARAIAYQQLHAAAAESILGRLIALFPGRRFPRPEDLLATDVRALRQAGFSQAKALALQDLAAKAVDGTVPSTRIIRSLGDEAIVERLVEVRGVGRWTVEMLLIFQLARPDVLPVDDFGIRNGFRIAYGRRSMPQPKQLLQYGERWRPFRSTAAWYLWRAAERARPGLPVRPPKM
jgi:DNA-3-methyladenine glycosylase II